jgi:hypothetical protein
MKRPDWRKLSEHLAHRLEAVHPALGKNLLSYASRVSERALMTTPYSLAEWRDERVGLKVRALGLGSVISAAEFMVRSLLSRHVPNAHDNLIFRKAEVEVLTGLGSNLHLRLELNAPEREAWLREAHEKGMAFKSITIPVWSDEDRRLGEIHVQAGLRHRPMLPAGAEGGV